jgi:hypothetical protein
MPGTGSALSCAEDAGKASEPTRPVDYFVTFVAFITSLRSRSSRPALRW